jgi:TonB family protein
LAVAGWLVVRRPAPSPPPAAAVTAPPATAVVESAITPLPTPPPAPAADAKAIQEEAQRQLALRRKAMQRAAEAGAKSPRAGTNEALSPASVPPTPVPVQPSPEVRVAEAQPTRVEPTAVPIVEVPPTASPRVPARPEVAEVSRGDLVGPGQGVVEPVFVSSPRIAYPPAARQQAVSGKVVVLILVNEEGTVKEAKLQQGLASKFGVNEAVLDSIRHAKFQPATKNGIPVKMWRTIVVDVRP